MLREASQIQGYAVHASDGAIGSVGDFLFDDATWLVRWLVIDTGGWLPGRKVVVPPSALSHVNHIGRQFSVSLTQQQVKECPDVGAERPVSRQLDGAGLRNAVPRSYLGMARYGVSSLSGSAATLPSPELMQIKQATDAAQRAKDDPALRSAKEVIGYHIHASDGEIGHVENFLVEEDDWSIHYLVVDTKNWWPGKQVLISPLSVREIDWAGRQVRLGADCQKVKDSPPYDPSKTVDPNYAKNFHEHFGELRLREGMLVRQRA